MTDFSIAANVEKSREGQAVLVGTQAAEPVAQGLGQHRNDAVGEVNAVAPLVGFDIEWRAGLHVVRDIRDVDGQMPSVPRGFNRDRVVKVASVVRVDRDDQPSAAVLASARGGRRHRVAEDFRRLGHSLGEGAREIVFADDRLDVDAGPVGRSEDLDDFALGVDVPRGPFAQFDHDLVALVRAQRGRGFRNVDVVDEMLVVRHDVPEAGGFLERAHRGGGAAFENADDPAPRLIAAVGGLVAQVAYDHAVAGQRGRGVFRAEIKLRISRFVAQQVGRAVAMQLDRPDHEVGIFRQSKAILADADDVAGNLQIVQGAGEVGTFLWGQLQGAGHFLHGGRGLSFPAHQVQHAGGEVGVLQSSGKRGGAGDGCGRGLAPRRRGSGRPVARAVALARGPRRTVALFGAVLLRRLTRFCRGRSGTIGRLAGFRFRPAWTTRHSP